MASITTGLIEKVQINSDAEQNIASTAYGECKTDASDAEKTVEMTGFFLLPGVTVHIKFINANTADDPPTLNINGKGAKPIVQYGTTAVGTTPETTGWQAGAVLSLTYDGTSWIRDQGYNTNTTYTHPTGAGNKHIPSGGSSGQFLGWSAKGTAKWVDNPDTDTHRPIQLEGTEILGNNTTALNFKAGSDIGIMNDNGILTITNTYSLPLATYNILGGLKPAYSSTGAATLTTPAATNTDTPIIVVKTTTSERYYAIEADKNGIAYVNVPWTDHYAWGDITGKPTKITLTGAVTGDVSLGSGDLSLSTTVNHNHDDRYKITSGVITLGSNTSTLVTSVNGNTGDVTITAESLDLSKAMRFIGVATVDITDESTTDPKIENYTTKTAGDVIIDKESSREYVWSTTGKWELLGGDESYWVSSSDTAAKFWRGDNTWSDTISGGTLKITNNSNTVTIGSQNANFTHIYNSADIPFIFNNDVLATESHNLGSASWPWGNLYIGANGNHSIHYVGTKATKAMITFLDNASNTNGNGIKIGGGGVVVIGAGESATSLSVAASDETLYLTSDAAINIEAGGNTIANRIGMQVTTAGHIIPVKAEAANNNVQDLGASNNKWANVYATTFHGTLDGNATSADYLSTARKLKVALNSTTDVTFDGSADVMTIPISETLDITHGGTGQTTLTDARALFSGPEFIIGTWTAASGTWTGTTTDSKLYDGKQIILYMPFAGHGNATLNLTLADGTTTGAKNVYFESTTPFTTHKGQNAQLHLIYHSALTLSNGTAYEGWWYIANRDTDNDYRVKQTIVNTDNTYSLLFSDRVTGAATNNTAYITHRNDLIYVNPSLGAVYATSFNGELTGNVIGNVTGDVSGSSGSCTGNAATATQLSTNATNTTASFWRGDNTWSNTLTDTLILSGTVESASTGATATYNESHAGPKLIFHDSDQKAYLIGDRYDTSGDKKFGFTLGLVTNSDDGALFRSNGIKATSRLVVNTTFDSTYNFKVSGASYLDGDTTIHGNLIFPSANILDQNQQTYRQRITITDDSTADTAVFTFQQSSNSGADYTNLFTIKDNGTVVATTFDGTATNADKVSNNLVIKLNNGTTENTNMYTYNGSAGKTLNIIPGSNITFTTAAGSLTIAGTANDAVTQNVIAANTNKKYGILFSAYETSTTTTTASSVYRDSKIYINPSLYQIVAGQLTLHDKGSTAAEKVSLLWNNTDQALEFIFV